MAQFDVHRNKGSRRAVAPYFVIVQSRRFDSYSRRTVIPLVLVSEVSIVAPDISPAFTVENRQVTLFTLQMASVPVEDLGDPVTSLASEGDRILAAIDMLISRAWG